jgi:hypothetical protein
MPAIPAFGKWSQEDCTFEASLGYIVRLCLKNPNNKKFVRSEETNNVK